MSRTCRVAIAASVLGLAGSGCHDPWATGPYGIRGQLLDGSGKHLPFKKVVSEEHGDTTESDGRFVVRWKDPATFVDVRHEGVTYRRRWQPDSDAGEVTVQLPVTHSGTLACRSDVECMAEILWDLGGGLTARLDIECGESAPIRVDGMPPGVPSSVSCPSVLGDRPMTVKRVGNDVVVQAEPLALPLSISGPPRGASCEVGIEDGQVQRGQGMWGLKPNRATWAWAICDGRVGTPTYVAPRKRGLRDEDAQVVLSWSATGPDLVLPDAVPPPRELTLARRGEPEESFKMKISPDASGARYALPPLPRGQYLLGLGSGALFASTNPPDPEVPGLVYLLKSGEVWGEDGGMVGALSLEEPLSDGTIEVQIQREEAGSPD